MVRASFKKLIVVMAVLVVSLAGFAQQVHFVYIQADNQQPFYVKYGSKNYSSSSIGYLILPKLSDGDFTIQVGFPKNLYPEQTFNLSVAGKDYGYALKNFDAKGWGLFNFQTTDIVMNINAAAASEPVVKQTVTTNNSNPFGNMLADAINDSTLNQQRVVPKDTVVKAAMATDTAIKKDTLSVAANTQPSVATDMSSDTVKSGVITKPEDSLAVNKSIERDSVKTIDSLLTNKAKSLDIITKSAENTTSNGTDLTFLDNASKDTIHAFIPSADTLNIEKKAAMADSAKSKVDNPFFNNNNSSNADVARPALSDTANSNGTVKSTIITNSNCQKMLSSYDNDKLKKKIISLGNQDAILAAVRKSLRDKCITTEQVKDLGNLFLSDENRYDFYDAVYPSVSDYFNFPQLQSTLIDTYYKNRFKALLR